MQQKYIFILGHMRSYSSLLSHILGSHDEISGYCELHQSYQSLNDFQTMHKKISFAYDKNIKSRFLLDKILHNQYTINDTILKVPNIKLIFLLRKPEETIKSIIIRNEINTNMPKRNLNFILNYYIRRLEYLVTYAQNSNKPIHFIEVESLLNNTENTLLEIKNFLSLSQSINAEYSLFKLTGKHFYGDSSTEMKSGKIINKQNKYKNIILPPKSLLEAQKAYDKSRTQLNKLDLMKNFGS